MEEEAPPPCRSSSVHQEEDGMEEASSSSSAPSTSMDTVNVRMREMKRSPSQVIEHSTHALHTGHGFCHICEDLRRYVLI